LESARSKPKRADLSPSPSLVARLHSHRSPVTSLHFLPHPTSSSHPGYLLSTSLDTLLKLWDLQTSHCVETVVAHRSAVHAAHVRFVAGEATFSSEEDGEEEVEEAGTGGWEVVTSSGEGEVKGWWIGEEALAKGVREGDDGEVSFSFTFLAATQLLKPCISPSAITYFCT